MTTALPSKTPEAITTHDASTRRRFTVREYLRMGEAGVFAPGERVELIEGVIRMMTPIGNRHYWLVIRLAALLRRHLSSDRPVAEQSGFESDIRTQLQPDIVVLRRIPDSIQVPVPGPGDAMLIVEVADSSLDTDRAVKLPLYAKAGVPEYWIVDVGGRKVETCRDPEGETYRTRREFAVGGDLVSPTVPELKIKIEELFA